MNKKILLIVGVFLLIGVGGLGYLVMKKVPSKSSTNQAPSPVVAKKNETKTETISTTLKSLLTGRRSLKCTFSNKTDTASVDGTVYAADGKMRGDFKTIAEKTTVNGHMIVDSKFSYVWTDTNNQGIKVPVSETQPTPDPKSKTNAPDLNQTLNYNCQTWSKDESLFNVPSNITFQSFTIPQVTNGAKQASEASQSSSSQCAACNNIPKGTARETCLTQLKCK